jgi:UDP-galactopyranose mutase
VNYPNAHPSIRITGFKHLTGQNHARTTPGVHFRGRLATHRDDNMDQVVAQASGQFQQIMGRPPALLTV